MPLLAKNIHRNRIPFLQNMASKSDFAVPTYVGAAFASLPILMLCLSGEYLKRCHSEAIGSLSKKCDAISRLEISLHSTVDAAEVTALGFFSLNHKNLGNIMLTLLTYLIIINQFYDSEGIDDVSLRINTTTE